MRRKRVLMGAVAATIALMGVSAGSADARFTKLEARDSVQIAWGFWRTLEPGGALKHGYACGPASIRLDWTGELKEAMAFAGIGACEDPYPKIWLETRTIKALEDDHGCAVITHEVGHLLGYRHVEGSEQLMSGDSSIGRKPPREATWDRARARCSRSL